MWRRFVTLPGSCPRPKNGRLSANHNGQETSPSLRYSMEKASLSFLPFFLPSFSVCHIPECSTIRTAFALPRGDYNGAETSTRLAKKEAHAQGETCVLFFRTTPKSDGKSDTFPTHPSSALARSSDSMFLSTGSEPNRGQRLNGTLASGIRFLLFVNPSEFHNRVFWAASRGRAKTRRPLYPWRGETAINRPFQKGSCRPARKPNKTGRRKRRPSLVLNKDGAMIRLFGDPVCAVRHSDSFKQSALAKKLGQLCRP